MPHPRRMVSSTTSLQKPQTSQRIAYEKVTIDSYKRELIYYCGKPTEVSTTNYDTSIISKYYGFERVYS